MEALKHKTFQTDAVDIAYLDEGEGPVIVCVHGFPENHQSWIPCIEHWVNAGHRVIAPCLRGFYPSRLAKNHRYGCDHHGDDILRLMDALQIEQAVLVGHDWGSIASFMAAVEQPERFSHLVMAAVPPIKSLWGRLRWKYRKLIPKQLKQLLYLLFFQFRGVSEKKVRKNNYTFLQKKYNDWSPDWEITQDTRASWKQILQGKHLTAALRVYRHTVGPLHSLEIRRRNRRKLQMPTLFVAGANDGCILPAFFQDLDPYCESRSQLKIIQSAGHFMNSEKPEEFSEAVLHFIKE